MLERVWRSGNPSYTVGGTQAGATTVENSLEVPQKTVKTEFPYDPIIAIPSIYLATNYTLKRFMHPLFIAAKLTIAKTWGQPNCPSRDEWIQKMHVLIHTENGHHSDT